MSVVDARAGAAPRERNAAALEKTRDFGETLRMPRNDDEERPRRAEAQKRVQEQRFLAVAGAGGDDHVAVSERLAPALPEGDLSGRRCHVELEVPGHDHVGVRPAKRTQALRVGFRLRGDAGELTQRFPNERQHAPVPAMGALRQACVRKKELERRGSRMHG